MAIALVLPLGVLTLPACKKKKADTQNPIPNPGTNVPPPNPNERDPYAPRSPVFGSDPRAAGSRVAAEKQMEQILFALHDFHGTYGSLPAGYADKTGKPGLSWRVAILPGLGEVNLHKQFKLDEPWDSPTNKPLISKMPAILAPPKQSTNGWTFYRGFTGPGTWLPPTQPGQPGQPLFGVKLTQISDGTSNTILVAEAYDPVIWTKPDELQLTQGNPPKLGGVFASGTVVGLADGSVKFLRPTVSPKTIANAILINDGSIVNLDE
jgi:hypothetical protein